MPCSKLARLGALLLLASSIGAEALKINFKRTPVPEHAKAVWARDTVVSRSAPSRVMSKRGLRVTRQAEPESDDDPEADPDAPPTNELLSRYYTAPITVGSKEYLVVLDTSNEDLLLDSGPEDGETSEIRLEYEYQTHGPTLKIDGSVGWAPVKFGTYEIDSQAYLDIEDDSDDFHSTFGFNGFFGLGLESTSASPINQAVKAAEGEDSTSGQSILQNIFASQPDSAHFIALDLARKEDDFDIDDFKIAFGEYPEEWPEIQDSPKIPLYPEDAKTWNIVIQRMTLDEAPLALTSTKEGVPEGAVAHVTATEHFTILPLDLFNELYESIEGSAGFTTEDGEKRWLVPCLTTSILTMTAGNVTVFIHPLDLSAVWTNLDGKPDVLNEHTVCVSAFRGIDNHNEEADIVLGSSFLRNVQVVFGFPTLDESGSVVEPAYFQMQADTEDIKMESQVTDIRGGQLEQLPAELEPTEAVKLLATSPPADDDDSPTPSSDGSRHGHHASPTQHSGNKGQKHHTPPHREHHTTTAHHAAPTPHHNGGSSNRHDSSARTPNTFAKAGEAESSDDSTFHKHLPVVLGLLGANILVGVALMVLAIMNYIKKGSARRSGAHVYVPVGKTADT